MRTKSWTYVVGALFGVAMVGASNGNAAVISIPGNYMISQPIYGANGPEGGGDAGYWAGTNTTYPANPNAADGDTSSGWGAGLNLNNMIFTLTAAEGVDANNAPEAPGFYQPDHFIQNTFGLIQTFRIYVGPGDYLSDTPSYQNNAPTQIGIHYSTATHTESSGGGWWGNAHGTPGGDSYTNAVTITGVSGGTPTLAGDVNDAVAITLGAANYTSDGNGHQYVDLTVNIPAGATSLQFDFGPSGYNPADPDNADYTHAIKIYDIQAAQVPEPASLALLGLGSLGLLVRRRRHA